MTGAQARLLPNGRLHLQHGPIDLVIEVTGELGPASFATASQRHSGAAQPNPEPINADAAGFAGRSSRGMSPSASMGSVFSLREPRNDGQANDPVQAAYDAAVRRFDTILTELCDELPALRSPASCRVEGRVARRMQAAVRPYAGETFVTPMAAVAGAVADEIVRVLIAAAPLRRAFVNNGGDIALHLAPGESTRIGLVDRPDRPSLFGTASLSAADGIGGIATSGWRGRSFSLGIADAVTVLARTAAEADAAATIIANAVDLPGHPAVIRVPARDLQADSDLGEMLVTREVGHLNVSEVAEALASGLARAEALVACGRISGAALHVQGRTVATRDLSHAQQRRAEEAGLAGRLEARATQGACFETRTCGPLLSMTPKRKSSTLGKVAA